MRYIRAVVILIFILSFVLDAGTSLWDRANRDTDMPVITCEEDYLEVRSDCTEEDLLAGLKAWDETDGDLTDHIMIGETSRFIEKGVCNIKYVVFDSSHNAAQLTRQVKYTDYESPRFSLTAPQVYVKGENIRFLDYVKASDLLEGDITDKIRIVSSEVDNYTPGTYPVSLEVTNSLGDTSALEMNVVIIDHAPGGPVITLSRYLDYVKKGVHFNPDKYIIAVTDPDGNEIENPDVKISGKVDTGKPGEYRLVYSVTDEETKTQGQTYLTIVVTE